MNVLGPQCNFKLWNSANLRLLIIKLLHFFKKIQKTAENSQMKSPQLWDNAADNEAVQIVDQKFKLMHDQFDNKLVGNVALYRKYHVVSTTN